MIAAVVLLGALCVFLAAVVWSWRPETAVRRQVRKRCLVTMKDGQAFAGVLWQTDRRLVVLRDASVAETGVTVDGEVLLHRADISFIQLP